MDKKTYIYTPWLRSGLGVAIEEQDDLGDNSAGSLLRAKIGFTTGFDLSRTKEGETDTKIEHKSIRQEFQIQGPVDIRNINENMILKTVPAHGVNNFEYNFAPYIDFKEKDFPWIYAPMSAAGEKMRPWLKLLVCKIDECEVNADKEFPFVTLSIENEKRYQKIMGEPGEAWKYAHVQLVEERMAANTKLSEHVKSKIDDCESNFISRILSPYTLEKDSAYIAFLIPGFETGRLAGLGIPLHEIEKSKIKAQESSFTRELSAQSKKKRGLDFPFYYKWNFGTGDGSFLVLAQRLEAAGASELPKDVCVDVSHMGDGLDYVNLPPSQKRRETIGVPMAVKPLLYNEEIFPNSSENEGEKILERNILNKLKNSPVFSENKNLLNDKSVELSPVRLLSKETIEQEIERQVALKKDWKVVVKGKKLKDFEVNKLTEEEEKKQRILELINSIQTFKISDKGTVRTIDIGDSMDDPWIVPPIYGAKHAMSTSLEKSPAWLQSLNLDIKNRIAAGLGVKVIQENQEMFMQRAWEQVELVNQLNQLIYRKLLQLKSNNMLYKQHAAFSDKLIQGLSSMKLITELNGTGSDKSGILSMANDAMLRIVSKKNIQDEINSKDLVKTMAENAQFVFKHKHPFYDKQAIDQFSYKLKNIVKTLVKSITEECEKKLTPFCNAMPVEDFCSKIDTIYEERISNKNKEKITYAMHQAGIKSEKSNLLKQIAKNLAEGKTPLYKKLEDLIEKEPEDFLKEISKNFYYENTVDDSIRKMLNGEISFGLMSPLEDTVDFFRYIPIIRLSEYTGIFLSRRFIEKDTEKQLIPYELKKEVYQGGNPLVVLLTSYNFKNTFKEFLNGVASKNPEKLIKIENTLYANVSDYSKHSFHLDNYSTYSEDAKNKCFPKNLIVLTEVFGHKHEKCFISPQLEEYNKKQFYYRKKEANDKFKTADLYITNESYSAKSYTLADFFNNNDIVLDALNIIAMCGETLEIINDAQKKRESYESKYEQYLLDLSGRQASILTSEVAKLREESIQEPETIKEDVEIIIGNIEKHIKNSFEYLVSKINSENLDEYIDTEFPVIAYPVFPEPASLYLQELSENFIIPETDKIPQNSISLYMSNSKFVESFLCGMNTEMAQEMLWREYPTDKRGSYFKTFWDKDEDLVLDHYSDIKSIHEWKNNLGNNQINNKVKDLLVFVVRGDLIKKYPDVISYLSPPESSADGKIRFSGDSKKKLLYPKLRNLIRKDILLLGFEINAWDAIKPPGNFLVFQERPSGIRFGNFKEVSFKNSAHFAKEHMIKPYMYAKHISSFL